jgi:hypothetical protein
MRHGAAEQIASETARAAARAEHNSVQNLSKYQMPVSAIGGEGVRQEMRETPILSGSTAHTFWLHTLIHTPYAPASCARTDDSSPRTSDG